MNDNTKWQVYVQADLTEGKGGMIAHPGYGLFHTEQDAWNVINHKGGVMGRHPSKFNFGPWHMVDNWQQYKLKNGHAADYDVWPVAVEPKPPLVGMATIIVKKPYLDKLKTDRDNLIRIAEIVESD